MIAFDQYDRLCRAVRAAVATAIAQIMVNRWKSHAAHRGIKDNGIGYAGIGAAAAKNAAISQAGRQYAGNCIDRG